MTTISWRTGANIRELAFYGATAQVIDNGVVQTKEVVKGSSGLWAEQQLTSLENIGVQVVRFYAAHQWFTAAAAIPLIKKTLDLIAAHHMQAIVCLNDSLGDRLFDVHGDESFHTEANLGHLRNTYWTQKAYENFYIPYITKIVTAFRSSPTVLMWDLGNEYGMYPNNVSATPAQVKAFLTFAETASVTIKNIAPRQLVSTGIVNTHHVASGGDVTIFSRKLHSMSSIDAISIHDYKGFNGGQDGFANIDVGMAKELGKPFYIGEFGARWPTEDRPKFYREKIDTWKVAGASIVMPWAYDDVTRPNPAVTDVGIGDDQGLSRGQGDFKEVHDIVDGFRGHDPLITLSHMFQPSLRTTNRRNANSQEQIQPFAQPQKYRVTPTGTPLHVRATPGGTLVTQPGTNNPILLKTNKTIVADARFKTEQFFWLRHPLGWSAECPVDNASVFLERVP
jgi:hypothetical protein